MKYPYGLVADLHLHAWRSFSTTTENGTNTRLVVLLKELARAMKAVTDNGGDTLIVAGDVFHVRGQIAPSVFNPTKATLQAAAAALGLRVVMMPGNHDMEFRESSEVGNSIASLASDQVMVLHETGYAEVTPGRRVLCVPWFDSVNALKKELAELEVKDRSETDLVLHAPIDGVIAGIPDHGLTCDYLAGLGFKRVFAGHYHNHKDLGRGVYSIGAIAHHTWSDVGTRAGFLLVHEDRVDYCASHAPEFVDVLPHMDETEVALRADGNYVRAKTHATDASKLNELREFLEKSGAQGVLIQHVPLPVAARDGTVARAMHTAGGSLEVSVGEFIKGATFVTDEQREALNKRCQAILAEASVV